jgi:hypothetical protein
MAMVFMRTGYVRPAGRFSSVGTAAGQAWNDADMLAGQIRNRIVIACKTGGMASGYRWKFRPDLDPSFALARMEKQAVKDHLRERSKALRIRERLTVLDDDFGLSRRSDDELLALYRALK